MAMIHKSLQTKENKDKDEKKHRKKHHKKSKHRSHASSENDSDNDGAALTVEKQREKHYKDSKSDKPSSKTARFSDDESGRDTRREKYYEKDYKDRRPSGILISSFRRLFSLFLDLFIPNPKYDKVDDQQKNMKSYYDSQGKEYSSEKHVESRHDKRRYFSTSDKPPLNESNNRHHKSVKLPEEERAARLREMQMDAERHEEQRWKRLKKAADDDAQEAILDPSSSGRNFLDDTQKSVYGAEKGGSSTIEESVRRRTHYSQRRSDSDTKAFRRS